jgi:hypothetical protein
VGCRKVAFRVRLAAAHIVVANQNAEHTQMHGPQPASGECPETRRVVNLAIF